ncbi:MAG: alanine racemase [Bacteroidales bacterium]|nr:alanine racemase [Bacteroidales bacterium]MDZ7739966.1 alanine racemase [Bacteroidales bacterium]
MLHTSYIELSKKALNTNIRFLKTFLKEGTRYSMVIKANAYGHGIEDLLPLIEECGVDHFSVFSVAEAMRAYKVKKSECDLMIMGWIDNDELAWAVDHDVSFYVFSVDRLKAACRVASGLNKPARIHLEIETGMHRTGFCEDELPDVIKMLEEFSGDVVVEGVCTHFAGAETISNYERIQQQISTFNRLCSWLADRGIKPRYRHTACSAAVLNFPETAMDMVRIGISSYGFWPSSETRMTHLLKQKYPEDPLKRVLSWKSKVMSVKHVGEGEYISYGSSYLTNRPATIATVPVGYGYGFSRNLSNLGHVLIHEKRVAVIGSVNMNMMIVDVTDLNDVQEGDEVVLIGTQGDLTITVSSFSDMNNSLNYELLTRLPKHIPRYVLE